MKSNHIGWVFVELFSLIVGLVLGVQSQSVNARAATPVEILNQQIVDYHTKIGPNLKHNCGIYSSGGYGTSPDNFEPIAYGRKFHEQDVHITREEQTNQGTWLKFTHHTFTGWIHQNGTVKSNYRLTAPLIAQRPELPTGCEITAVTMMLQFAGQQVTKLQLAKEMPRSHNPNKGFVGSPYSRNGWYIYPAGLTKLVAKHVGTSVNMTGKSLSAVKMQIHQNHLAVVWLANFDGFANHAVTVTGYSKSRIYYNDPWTVRRSSLSNHTFQKHWRLDAYRALSY
ncbi:MAG: C39 family peptidase [Lentilactobacillus diolivorans]|jgi:uncharacterized protein YvpB|nr:C39 family peptidase [Lentilactobacillus diolivorans]RRG01657.1 MAG: hypothetical protein DUD34_11415 [Lactobacillus sp.]